MASVLQAGVAFIEVAIVAAATQATLGAQPAKLSNQLGAARLGIIQHERCAIHAYCQEDNRLLRKNPEKESSAFSSFSSGEIFTFPASSNCDLLVRGSLQ